MTPPPVWPPPPPPHNPQHNPQHNPNVDHEKAGLFRAGKIALWIWIVAAVVPLIAIVLCCALCGFGSILSGTQSQ